MRNQFTIPTATWLSCFTFGALIGLFIVHRRNRAATRQYTGLLPSVIPVNRYPAAPDYFLDAARADFLRRLENAQIALSPWEEGFVENNIGRICYSARQRIVIDGLMTKYERLPRG